MIQLGVAYLECPMRIGNRGSLMDERERGGGGREGGREGGRGGGEGEREIGGRGGEGRERGRERNG